VGPCDRWAYQPFVSILKTYWRSPHARIWRPRGSRVFRVVIWARSQVSAILVPLRCCRYGFEILKNLSGDRHIRVINSSLGWARDMPFRSNTACISNGTTPCVSSHSKISLAFSFLHKLVVLSLSLFFIIFCIIFCFLFYFIFCVLG